MCCHVLAPLWQDSTSFWDALFQCLWESLLVGTCRGSKCDSKSSGLHRANEKIWERFSVTSTVGHVHGRYSSTLRQPLWSDSVACSIYLPINVRGFFPPQMCQSAQFHCWRCSTSLQSTEPGAPCHLFDTKNVLGGSNDMPCLWVQGYSGQQMLGKDC